MNDLANSLMGLTPVALARLSGVGGDQLGSWLVCGAAAAVIANQGFTLWKNLTGHLKELPPPSTTYATIANCKAARDKIYDRMLAVDKGADAQTNSLRLEMKNDVKGIHSRIDEVLAKVSEVSGQVSRIGRDRK